MLTSGLVYLVEPKGFPLLLPQKSLSHATFDDSRLLVLLAFPSVLSVLLVGTSLFCAFLGLYEMEEDREWLVRCGGWMLAFNVFWIAAHGVAMYGEYGMKRLIAGATGVVLGLGGSALGFSKPVFQRVSV